LGPVARHVPPPPAPRLVRRRIRNRLENERFTASESLLRGKVAAIFAAAGRGGGWRRDRVDAPDGWVRDLGEATVCGIKPKCRVLVRAVSGCEGEGYRLKPSRVLSYPPIYNIIITYIYVCIYYYIAAALVLLTGSSGFATAASADIRSMNINFAVLIRLTVYMALFGTAENRIYT